MQDGGLAQGPLEWVRETRGMMTQGILADCREVESPRSWAALVVS